MWLSLGKQESIEKYRPIDKQMNMPAGQLDTPDIYYKVVRRRTNGKIHTYLEEFINIESAKIRMIQSVSGKYFGQCKVYIYKVYKGTGRADIVKEMGVDRA